jgi:N-acetylglutamate synthase-like GNAT family acetyltransferase
MRVDVLLEPDPKIRRELQERLTAMLQSWFGKPEANAKYAGQAEVLDGYIAMGDRVPRGLLLLKYHSPSSAEVYWIGVDPTWHRSGIGRALIKRAGDDARARGVRYLFVATLHPADPYEPYQRTRCFYEAMGFSYVLQEQFSADPENPMAYYLKEL